MSEFTRKLPPDASIAPPPIGIDHTAAALARLPEQFKGKPNLEMLLRVILTSVQELETAGQQLLTLRDLDHATGVQLDIIGKIVGQPRNGLSNDDYRRYCRARIAANRSKGTVGDILRVITLVLNDPTAHLLMKLQGIAAYVLEVEDVAISAGLAAIVLAFMIDCTAGGVRPILESSANEPSTWFKWDTPGRGWDHGTWIDARDPASRF